MRLLPATGLAVAVTMTATVACAASSPAAHPSTDAARARPALTGTAPCPDEADLICSTLTVPLDHSGTVRGTLDLRVAVTRNAHPAKGDLVFLSGGPGQPDEPLAPRVLPRIQPLLAQYRIVFIDQRGTGANALQCPELQTQMGSSDLTAPTAGAVTDCAAALGPDRRFYSTADTVADLDDLRRALGDDRVSLDGVSYGTFTAERYALAHPAHVSRMVLDSVVPQTGYDALDLAAIQAVPRVLRASCAAVNCGFDPAADVAAVVRHYHDGVVLLDTLTSYEFVDPNYTAMLTAIHQAAQGSTGALDGIVAGVQQGSAATPDQLSQGLHASTLCADGVFPWGTGDTPVATRPAALAATRDRLTPVEVAPFDAATATGFGSLLACLSWPREQVPPAPAANRHIPGNVRVLLIGGDRDLSTPLACLYQEAALVANGKVVVVPGASHSVQTHAASDLGRQAAYAFLLAS
ncbi:alpha/beta fold hydrolase [Streptacidiphilus jiangxiensis]|uniref:prolyl aminopeptidase n=1 Tax=Streptacidiphilus jiangxiensis TaxID=235985 RepID=A0A1H7WPZ6_STRJI|nr:alpha/beta fold hydrolase [Streptacidiphilus jiangxiensis]SEM23513.1 alpha/beta hydrolase fold [Streptacidiphilus jiangxiensis]